MFKVLVEYPSKEEEYQILERFSTKHEVAIKRSLTLEQIRRMRQVVDTIYMDEKVKRYILDIVFATRTPADYGLESVAALQNTWLAWVRQGFPPIPSPRTQPGRTPSPELLAADRKRSRPEPNLIYRIGKSTERDRAEDRTGPAPAGGRGRRDRNTLDRGGPYSPRLAASPQSTPQSTAQSTAAGDASRTKGLPVAGWHASGEERPDASATVALEPAEGETVSTQVTHPQPVGRPGQIILEWTRR
jgi:hypothetical protein